MNAIITEQEPYATNDYITVFTQYAPAGKTFERDERGFLKKESAIVAFATGQVHHVPTVESFAAILTEVSNNSNQCIMLGYIPTTQDGAPFELTSEKDYLERMGDRDAPFFMTETGMRVAPRLKRNVIGSSWCMLDRDITPGMSDEMAGLSQDEWIDHVAQLLPGLRECGKVISSSSSGRLVIDGVQQASKNFHLYYQIQDPVDLERIGSAMLINSFDYGLGYHKPIGSGDATVPWSIFDPTTFSRERLCYEAAPVVIGPGLEIAPADIQYYTGNRLDTSFVPTPEGSRHGLSMSTDAGGGTVVAGDNLDLDQTVITRDYGNITIRQFRDDWNMPEKIRCQCFNRDSVSMNAYLQKLPGGRVLYFDNGMRLKMVARTDVTEVMGGMGIPNLEMQEPVIATSVVNMTTGDTSYMVDNVLQLNLIADLFMALPEIQDLHLINYQDNLYRYEVDKGGYVACEKKWLTNRVTKFIPKCYSLDVKTGMPILGNPGRNTVNSVVGCIMAEMHEEDWEQSIPFYRHGERYAGQVGANKLIVFRNGSLDIETKEFTESSPELFVLNPLPYDYNKVAVAPTRFMQFLDEVWPNDPKSHDLLQEFFGYLISGETNMQKIFTLIGVRRGGKGVIGRLMKALVGGHAIAGTTLKGVSENFGMQGLLDKKVWLIADARVGKHIDQATVVERLLTISGEDTLNVPRKGQSDWTGRLGVRTVIMSNVMPMLFEPSGAMLSRLVTLQFNVSFEGREDIYLEKKLLDEISGIVNWALDGLSRLRKIGRFTECAATFEMKEDFKQLSNPLHGFTDVIVGESFDGEALCSDVFLLWNSFRQREGITIGASKQSFGHLLKTVYPNVSRLQVVRGGQRVYVYKNMQIIGVQLEGMQ